MIKESLKSSRTFLLDFDIHATPVQMFFYKYRVVQKDLANLKMEPYCGDGKVFCVRGSADTLPF